MHYLLPCQCGQKLPVDTSQAGLPVRCACGAELQVPTLRGLAALERATETSLGKPAGEWGPRQAAAFLGLSILAIALAVATALWLTFPKFPEFHFGPLDRQAIEDQINSLKPQDSFEYFEKLRQEFPPEGELQPIADYQQKATAHRRYLLGAAAAAALGVLVILGSFLAPRGKPQPRAGQPPKNNLGSAKE